ncbi:MAG: TIGR03032 family protein [Planctomycetales bacterium]|nr:TIGR03032 family protein [Planctomycetales bacterium]
MAAHSTDDLADGDNGSAERQPRVATPLAAEPRGDFVRWLAAARGTLAVTTYTSGKLVLASAPAGELVLREIKFTRPMGMSVNGPRLAIAVREQLLIFRRDDPTAAGNNETIYRQVETYDTGKLNVHDVAFGRRGVHFANTRYNCIARPSDRVNFLRVWQPPFIAEMIAQDRCHLNGLGMRDGRPAMTTAFCECDHKGGWREENRFASGVLIDMGADRVVATGLCMPHSPRWAGGAWWLCNSGEGTLCRFDPASGQCEPIAYLPGFTRGLSFAAGRAIVGLSKIRPEHILDAPPVRDRHGDLQAGVALIDAKSGRETGALQFTRGGNEVFETAFLPGVLDAQVICQPAA